MEPDIVFQTKHSTYKLEIGGFYSSPVTQLWTYYTMAAGKLNTYIDIVSDKVLGERSIHTRICRGCDTVFIVRHGQGRHYQHCTRCRRPDGNYKI